MQRCCYIVVLGNVPWWPTLRLKIPGYGLGNQDSLLERAWLVYPITWSFSSCSWYKTVPNPMLLASACGLNGFIKSVKAKPGAEVHITFNVLKASWHSVVHWIGFFLMSCVVPRDVVIERLGYPGIPLYEVSVIVHKPQKASQFHNCNRGRHFLKASTLWPSAQMPSIKISCPK